MKFFNLSDAEKFPDAEWARGRITLEQVICPVADGHRRDKGRQQDLTIVLESLNIGDFVWTWLGECIITEKVAELFRDAGFTGYELKPVIVEKIKRPHKHQKIITALWELVVKGKGGNASPESGIRVIETCEACGLIQYSSYRNGIIVDETQWDGSDFFTINGYPRYILVTERVSNFIIANQLVNCVLIPSNELRWPQGVIRPEEDK